MHPIRHKQHDMKISLSVTVLITLIALSISCINNQNQANSNKHNKEELANNNNSLDAGMHISKSLLGINMGIKPISYSELNSLNYNQLFRPEGMLNVVAYYDKQTHQLNQPTKSEDFLLVVVNYENSKNAKKSFERIKSDAKMSNSNQHVEIDQKISNRLELLELGANYGGLITYNANQVFSLIENCEKSPLNKR